MFSMTIQSAFLEVTNSIPSDSRRTECFDAVNENQSIMPHWEVGDITPTLLLIYNLYCLRIICTQNTTEAVQHQYNVGGLFVWAVGEDDKNSSQVWTERRRKNPTNNWSTNQLSKQLFKQWDGHGIVLILYSSARAPAWPGRANTHLKRAISQQGISNGAK